MRLAALDASTRPWLFPTAALIGVILSLGKPMSVHDIYTNLMNSGGSRCCDETDRRPAPYRFTGNGVLMWVDGAWITVPSATIMYRTLPGDDGTTGGGHWCGSTPDLSLGLTLMTRCAILPPNAASVSARSEDGPWFDPWP